MTADGDRTAIDRIKGIVARVRRWLLGRGGSRERSRRSRDGDGVDPRSAALDQRGQEKIDRFVELAKEKGEENEGGNEDEENEDDENEDERER